MNIILIKFEFLLVYNLKFPKNIKSKKKIWKYFCWQFLILFDTFQRYSLENIKNRQSSQNPARNFNWAYQLSTITNFHNEVKILNSHQIIIRFEKIIYDFSNFSFLNCRKIQRKESFKKKLSQKCFCRNH